MNPKIAFFDLDKTLLSINSGGVVFRRMRKTGHIGLSALLKMGATATLYELGLVGAESFIRTGTTLSKGLHERDVQQWYDTLWAEEVRHTVRPGAKRAVDEHKAQGAKTMIITSSTPFIARLAQQDLGIDGWLAPAMPTVDGVITGECEEPICTGVGKIHHAQKAAAAAGVTLAECAFYSDSYSDLPLLAAVGQPFIVAPDPRLKRVAIARGWPTVDWG